MYHVTKSLSLLLLSLLVLSGCGKNTTKKGDDPVRGGSVARSAADCEKDWQTMIGKYKVGMVKAYRTTVTNDGGGIGGSSTSSHTETVTAVTPDEITYDFQVNGGTKSSITMRKAQFLEACKTGGANPPSGFKYEVLASGVETITVPAGPFECNYTRAKITSTDKSRPMETISETWISRDGRSILVRSWSDSTMTVSGTTFKTNNKMDLTELKIP